MNPAPFYENEYRIMQAFLSGDSKELAALRNQLDSLRYQSALYKPGCFLGLPYRASGLKRSSKTLRFKVGWGIGAEDWRLGDRRAVLLNDVVVRVADGSYICAELRIDSGLLQELRLIGVIRGYGNKLEAFKGALRDLKPEQFYFASPCTKNRDIGYTQLSQQRDSWSMRKLHPPQKFPNPTDFQNWILSIDAITIEAPEVLKEELGLTLPLCMRRGQPASEDEIESFESRCKARYGATIPGELREFWCNASVGIGHFLNLS